MSPLIAGQSKIFGILGYPIHHTLSPIMQNAAFDGLSLPCHYLQFEVHPDHLERAVRGIIPLDIHGLNITLPHKEAVIPYLDELAGTAKQMGAVNTIARRGDALIGHNTDGEGFIRSLTEAGIDPSGKRVLLLGAGGVARSVSFSLAETGVSEMVFITRNKDRGEGLAKALRSLFPGLKISVVPSDLTADGHLVWHPAEHLPTILVNATPLGMKKEDPLPFPESSLRPGWVVVDLVYRPRETPLLRSAKRVGAQGVPGIGMLLHQGALAFEIWLKEKAPLSLMREALERALAALDRC